ncbi:Mdj2p ASCRUDRAFT_71934 [Ascoidea rubescens DSM 1968]|uniref:J domain-containing protein n=1 Tax=Ascoidea rubescens DSM 1968 TaxID=1344418 RepID=A0A1D2VC51_9ASCO|nr:hypothetical protein ASCRUDRAFT_71934 [Ascoidea rubescens DSM 1968]ODV59216.1 hypothetical protein ASCRUDRAFT_71934 [Ascoidea rubescens DSM 1968]
MVVPLVIGVVITCAAITGKATIRAMERYAKLTPIDIARLNNIKLVFDDPKKQKNSFADRSDMFKDVKIDLDLLKRFKNPPYSGGFDSRMTENEALLILDISRSEILSLDKNMLKAKHRKCIIKNHPDRGGSPYLATKINQAKDLLEKSYFMNK